MAWIEGDLKLRIDRAAYAGAANPVDIVHDVLAEGMRRGEVPPTRRHAGDGAGDGTGHPGRDLPHLWAAQPPLSDAADDIAQGIWAAIAKPGVEQ